MVWYFHKNRFFGKYLGLILDTKIPPSLAPIGVLGRQTRSALPVVDEIRLGVVIGWGDGVNLKTHAPYQKNCNIVIGARILAGMSTRHHLIRADFTHLGGCNPMYLLDSSPLISTTIFTIEESSEPM
jgi:hypothetical protein